MATGGLNVPFRAMCLIALARELPLEVALQSMRRPLVEQITLARGFTTFLQCSLGFASAESQGTGCNLDPICAVPAIPVRVRVRRSIVSVFGVTKSHSSLTNGLVPADALRCETLLVRILFRIDDSLMISEPWLGSEPLDSRVRRIQGVIHANKITSSAHGLSRNRIDTD
jgi:hypothetical protein